jgi:hypothetical protein
VSRFTGGLYVKLLEDGDIGYSPDEILWVLLRPVVYTSTVANQVFVIPEGFITDFASVPRIPVVYELTGDTAHKAAVVHDYLYSTGLVSRETADSVLEEASGVTKVPAWRRAIMWAGVRLGGWLRFNKNEATN